MPPQKTNLTSKTGRDAAGLRLELAVPLVEEVTGKDLAAGRPDAPIAARRDAFSEAEAARQSAASTWNVLSLIKRYWRAFQARRQRERFRISLHDLSERDLADIGLTPGDIDYIVAHQTIERLRDGITYLWPSRGMSK
jgi:uncharacterized protein YjiS (DUF1127 family)